jgi:hypothetical protein
MAGYEKGMAFVYGKANPNLSIAASRATGKSISKGFRAMSHIWDVHEVANVP